MNFQRVLQGQPISLSMILHHSNILGTYQTMKLFILQSVFLIP